MADRENGRSVLPLRHRRASGRRPDLPELDAAAPGEEYAEGRQDGDPARGGDGKILLAEGNHAGSRRGGKRLRRRGEVAADEEALAAEPALESEERRRQVERHEIALAQGRLGPAPAQQPAQRVERRSRIALLRRDGERGV